MIRLGVTGGIGMGKSASAELLERWRIPVVDTDLVAREIVQPGQPALEEIRSAFGDSVIGADGRLDRRVVAERVFGDPQARRSLEEILHPRIRAVWQRQLEAWGETGCPIGAVVIPLLFETHAEACFDAVLCVACSAKSQVQRLRLRGWTDEESARRIGAQMPVEDKIARSRFVVWTEPPLVEHALQLRRVLATLGVDVSEF